MLCLFHLLGPFPPPPILFLLPHPRPSPLLSLAVALPPLPPHPLPPPLYASPFPLCTERNGGFTLTILVLSRPSPLNCTCINSYPASSDPLSTGSKPPMDTWTGASIPLS